MTLYILKEILTFDNRKVGVIEAKDFLLQRFKITEELLINKNIDTRIMACIAQFNESTVITNDSNEVFSFEYMIYVYDYAELSKDTSINRAIIAHELAHIYYPPKTIQQELECDFYATKQVSPQAVYNYLTLAIKEMKKIGKSTRDLEVRKITIEALL